MELMFGIIAVVLLSVVAFWKRYAFFFMLLAGASLMLGLQWFDVYVTKVGLSISLMLIGYSFTACAFAFKYMFIYDEAAD